MLANDPGELPPVLDYECRTNVPGAGTARQAAVDFLVEVERLLGVKPVLYTSPGYWMEFGSSDMFWRQYDLWLAHYTTATNPTVPAPWLTWKFWQYSCTGPGLLMGAESKELDMNYFNGDAAALYAYAGGTPQPPEPLALPARVRVRANGTNIRNYPVISAASDVGDLSAGKLLDVTGEAGNFWQVKAFVAKSVVDAE